MMRDQRKWGNFSIPGKNVSFLDRTHTDALAYVGACAQPRTHREKRGDVGAARLLHEPHQRRPLEGHWEALNPQGPKCHAYTLLQCTHRWQRGEWVPLPPSGLGQLQVGATLSPSKTKKKKCTPRLPRQIECRLTELTVVKRTSDVVERRGGGRRKTLWLWHDCERSHICFDRALLQEKLSFCLAAPAITTASWHCELNDIWERILAITRDVLIYRDGGLQIWS